MEGFEKGLLPWNSTASPKSTGFVENNENDSSQDTTIPNFQNHRKTVIKNFMSPTISAASKAAASKAAAPRKKILRERKENLGISDVIDHKMLNLNLKSSSQTSSRSDRFSYRNVSSHDLVSESEDDWDIKLSDDSSAKAYDPLKNSFFSPRPKYLRFNPNRRREIAERLEREVRDELISSSESLEVNEQESSQDEISSFSPLKEMYMESESVEKTEEDDLDTNLEDAEEDEEEEEKGWCLGGVLKIVLTLIACFLSTSYICSMNSPAPSSTQQAIWNLRDGYLMIQRQTLEFVNMKMQNAGVFEVEVGDVYSEVEDDVTDEDYGRIGIVENYVENLERHENDDNRKYIVKDAEFEFKQAAKDDETTISAYSLKEENDLNNSEASATEITGGGGVESETHNAVSLIDAKTVESGDVGGSVLEEIKLPMKYVPEEMPKESKIVRDTDSLPVVIGFHEKLIDSVTEVDEMEGSNQLKCAPEETPKLEELVPSLKRSTDSVDEIAYGNEVEIEKKAGWSTLASVIGIFAAASTLLALVYHSKRARSQSSKESKSILKPHKFALEDKVADRKVEFLPRPSSPPRAMELSRRLYAPSVELIGEILVGSHRSRAKYETEFEESNAAFSTPTKQQSVITSSPSYGGSLTNDRKIVKEEGGGQVGDAATPVRRSSRLRNRALVITNPY